MIATVILAAGASKRMGVPKQLLKWGDSTLLEHAIVQALQLNTIEVIVVLGANFNRIKPQIEHYPITILNNKNWEVGLGKSIAFAVEYLIKSKRSIEGVLITLADQPFIESSFLNLLIDGFLPNKSQIIATLYEDAKQGVPVLFCKKYFNELSYLNDDIGAKVLLEKHGVEVKVFKPKIENIDMDFKIDYNYFYNKNFKK
ncbi:hypothetical protein APS56_00890 [Pseudalgibacter alginicilyticus]|uniref:MobA-like NTP transferase domain-containing protein n=1 Tax=Pseudalgibacter alginicilyticus TaxID=1736674 RepID=A0A0P0CZU1_9FLAO|nr:nucleotidyltransferase family protein [Pseudalgibacter alginicilyticus]ALJ03793.1 hypothetical protein APS56_00890 [Pseudalgibacter alginicilyticus]